MTADSEGPTAKLCYLCGKELSPPTSVDHVPPKQLFAKELRKKHNLQLTTVKVHDACNKAFEFDEKYFLHSLAPFGVKTVGGRPVFDKVIKEFNAGEHRALVMQVLKEFDRRPGGVILPHSLVAKHFEGDRIARVAWKIVRGLAFLETGVVYPEDWQHNVSVTAPGQRPPEHFILFNQVAGTMPDKGRYPGIFAYRHIDSDVADYWALLLWDALIITVVFQSLESAATAPRQADDET